MLTTLKLLKKLEQYPVFNIQQFKALTKYKPDYARLAIHRLIKNKLIKKIERNKYTVHNDAFLISSYISWPSYISMWSALRYYNLTDQIVNNIQVITARPRKDIEFNKIKIRFFKINKSRLTNYTKKRYENHEIFIAEPEKALADALLFKTISQKEAEEIISKNKLSKRKIERLLE